MPFFNVNTTSTLVSLFYTLTGPATLPPALLLHGWTCDSHDWSFQIPYLTETHNVIAVDMRGHGRSSAPENIPYTPELFASDAVALLNHLGYSKDVIVVGHSLGGATASTIAIMYPEVVKGLVLVDPAFWLSEEGADAIFEGINGNDPAEFGVQAFRGTYTDLTPVWMRTWYERRLLGTPIHVVKNALSEVTKKGGIGRESVDREFLKARKAPRLAIYAGEDNADKERRLGVGKFDEVVVIGGVGHWPHHVKVDEVNSIIGGWLKKLETKN